MGGRGASSGISAGGNKYGTEYRTVLKSGNIKFVIKNNGSSKAPMETMTKGRVYVTVNDKNELKNISYYDKSNKRYKQIDLTHSHFIDGNPERPHTHIGYFHNEKGNRRLSKKEQRILDKVQNLWYNKNGR